MDGVSGGATGKSFRSPGRVAKAPWALSQGCFDTARLGAWKLKADKYEVLANDERVPGVLGALRHGRPVGNQGFSGGTNLGVGWVGQAPDEPAERSAAQDYDDGQERSPFCQPARPFDIATTDVQRVRGAGAPSPTDDSEHAVADLDTRERLLRQPRKLISRRLAMGIAEHPDRDPNDR
jgi:hypothetical protein